MLLYVPEVAATSKVPTLMWYVSLVSFVSAFEKEGSDAYHGGRVRPDRGITLSLPFRGVDHGT